MRGIEDLERLKVMTIERAIEILDPEHREHYDSIEPVNEACRMGMNALKELSELKSKIESGRLVELTMHKNRRKKVGIPIFGGNLVLWGYDTERDMNKAKKDIERMLMNLSSENVYNIIKFLAPYRAEMAKLEQLEYNDLTEISKNGKTN